MQPAEEGRDHAADHDVVEMRDDEVGVVQVDIRPSAARNRPVRPPMVNRPMKPSAYSIGASKRMKPLCSVPIQLNTLIADGTATK